jgi:hypothetical protein
VDGNLIVLLEVEGDWKVVSVPAPLNGQWHHFAAVHDLVGGTMRVYLDGAVAGTEDISGFRGKSIASPFPLLIGAYNDASDGKNRYPGTEFKGWLDDMIFYRRSLSPAEVQALFDSDKDNDPSGIVARFNLGDW